MHDYRSLDDFLKRIEPRLQTTQQPWEAASEMLEQTVEELKVAVEELRVVQEERAASALRDGDEREAGTGGHGRFRDAFTAAPTPLLLTDTAGMVDYANAAAAALLGVRAGQLTGKPLAVFVAPTSRRAFRTLLNRLAGEAAQGSLELELQPRARAPLQVNALIWPVPGGQGMSFAWSLTELGPGVPAPQADNDTADMLRAAFDSLPVGVAAMDLDGSVLAWNRAAGELLGWTEDELVGLPNPAVADEAALDAVRARGEASAAAATAEARDGSVVAVDLTVAPMLDAQGGVAGTVALFRPSEHAGAPVRFWPESEMRRVLLQGANAGNITERLRAGIAAGLHAGYLRGGDRLPSIRDAAAETGIDHRVLALAYRRLAAAGLVEVRSRKGVRVAAQRTPAEAGLGETAEWLAGLLEHAAALQVRVPGLPELVRRWTSGVELQCACVDDTADGRAALCHAISHQWGIRAFPVDPRGSAESRRELAEALRTADLVVTTHFHAPELAPQCDAARRPLLLAALVPEAVQAVEERLARGPLTAVVADPVYGERLRALRGGEKLNIVCAADVAAVEALDADPPVLATLAAQQQVTRRLRQLVPATNLVAPAAPRALARLLVRANVSPRRDAED
ncbi:MAG TPA: PAS domain-containing protein [Longimicrobium sp.]|nr:PAS domain-containing protein [Longimicrobium sp.]